ncbi:lytic transglycosylase domain-containing protein [Pseudogulbenkiania subflava]|uniref:Soluble lytic murein transglycosylase n=1 Tax=Pseudogulbenkiania subflava DSM 22618 TaxID=1123014 RepID=A0A1Y6BH78_9NEIS|nr:lytic transglycosylase domain-containing protein [Pseudogulbenkiania subflava]SMF11546.1 soluble lytic murein transglycosylase [Pseudogulbenkiania subflava DSM 22618]
MKRLNTVLSVLALSTALPALAAVENDLIAAREAYRSNNVAELARYASITSSHPLANYPAYWLAWKALEKDDDAQVITFLNSVKEGVMPERIRNEWLKHLGKREEWARFAQEWQNLPPEGSDEETRCYANLLRLRQGSRDIDFAGFLQGRDTPLGCETLIETAVAKGLLGPDWVGRRIRLQLVGNYLTSARKLATATGLTLDASALARPASADASTPGGQEILVYDIVRNKGRANLDAAADSLRALEPSLSRERAGFAWGQLALLSAKRQQMAQALSWFAQADATQLTDEQWEWWARSTLRIAQWGVLEQVTRSMPANLAAKPVWQYWRARALQALGRGSEATSLLVQASDGHQYYATLAREELGTLLSASPSAKSPGEEDIGTLNAQPGVRRALALFHLAEDYRKPEFRNDARNEWRWSMRNLPDSQLLAAAELARRHSFYDMAIYSAERTRTEHDFSLRYLTPYRDITRRYAKQLDIDEAWVYGLIRQESRFVTVARSGVGASGLMQLMPATAKWVAGKMGLNGFAVDDIDTNIQLGTWYLRYVLNSLSNNAVMATAAYNAGPGRARSWQDSKPLEGAIYAETIPFDETRDYVQKVMGNAAYYASGFEHTPLSLKNRLGTIPAR